MDHMQQLGEERIGKLLLRFSIPAIVGMLVSSLYNVIDRIFVGQGIGSLGIAGVTIGFPIMIVQIAFSMLISIGANSLMSIRLGEGKKDEAERIMGNAVVLLVIVAMILTVAGLIWLDPILKLFGASAQDLSYARDYMSVSLYGAVFQSVGFGMNNFIRADGSPKIAMGTMLFSAFLNAVLAPVFIFWCGWGMKGAALATVLAQVVAAVWVLFYFAGEKSILKLRLANFKLRGKIVLETMAIGSAPCLMQLGAGLINVLLNNSLARYGGDVAISAMGIVNSISTLIVMPVIGLNQGVQPVIGYNYGACQYDRVKKTLKLAIGAAVVITTLGFAAVETFPQQIIRLFNTRDQELLRLGTVALRIFLMMFPIVGFQIVSAGYFQAVGKPLKAMLMSLSRQVLVLIPALLILPRFLGLHGIFWAAPTADLIASLITGTLLFFELRHLNRKHSETLVSLNEAMTPKVNS
jgi:putative MATE family efflux protein